MILIILLLYSFHDVISYSSKMLNSCSKTLSTNMMGSMPAASNDRSIQVKRNGVLVTDNQYIGGENLKIYISNSANQYFFDTNLGTFSGSNVGCSGKRTIINGNTLTMPNSGEVTIKVGWALGYSQVKYTSITLNLQGSLSLFLSLLLSLSLL